MDYGAESFGLSASIVENIKSTKKTQDGVDASSQVEVK